ncbi:MAG: hypothetical protein ACI81L_000622 [Verrucomicrobiales bacterium]|jgi:hypothetical protein
MSLWTPGGEHEVPRDQPNAQPTETPTNDAPASGPQFNEEALAEALGIPSLDDLSDEERTQLEAAMTQMAETERQLSTTPPEVVIANHAMGMYELGAIHLRQNPPNLNEASLAIDALGALVDALEGRLGENEPTLREARAQLQQAFVAANAQ